MGENISRRDFLKVAGAGIAATFILTGCGPDSRYVVRTPYIKMPEYSYNGLSTYYATTCRECPAGCGIVVRTMQGRALKVEGNKNHPVNLGKTCSRGQASLQGLYNPDRIQHPLKKVEGGGFQEFDWDSAVSVVSDALGSNQPGEIAFLLGLTPDHLADLITVITTAMGAPAPWRYGAFAMFEGRTTLAQAAGKVFGIPSIPFFDLGNADLTFSFGANFLETWLSPVAYGRAYGTMRQDHRGKRGYLIQFEPRLSQTAAAADEWIPVVPGSEGLAALGIGRAVADLRGETFQSAYQNVDLTQVANATGVNQDTYRRLAKLFETATHCLAIPGGSALGASNGLEAGQAILALDVLANNLGKPGGTFITPSLPVHDANLVVPNTLNDIKALVLAMKSGAIKTLFVHGVNPLHEFPASLGFAEALRNVPQVISFASFPDETSQQATYILPDHTSLESWGYQKILTGADRPTISGSQPVVSPYFNTRASADVLLAAIQGSGGALSVSVPYKDEVEFLQASVQNLLQQDGYFNAAEMQSFWAMWQQYGGWWNGSPGLGAPSAPSILGEALDMPAAEFEGDGDLFLFPFPSPLLSDGSGANKPWLQETPDPTTTVMWNTWVEIHPDTADKLGLQNDDVVKVASPFGELEASVYRYPAIRPDTIAIPFGQGHTAYGRYAQNRGANLAALLGTKVNSANDLALSALKVTITNTGKKRPLARMESVLGVYGNLTP